MANLFYVKEYIERAQVDEFGYHKLDAAYPANVIHIYNSKREFNILVCRNNIPESPDSIIIGKLYFSVNNEVCMIRVNDNGVADFDHPVMVSINTECQLDDLDFIKRCRDAFGVRGKIIARVLELMATEGMSKSIKELFTYKK